MMEILPVRSWKAEFARSAGSEWLREEQRKFVEAKRKEVKEEVEQNKTDDPALDELMVIASMSEVADFTLEVDQYDAATVAALTENEEQLKLTQDQIKEMLERAYVLPDGRRVFKSEDGVHIFDETGTELKASDLDPHLIESWRPTSEQYFAGRKAEATLLEERTELLDFQERVDKARVRVDEGDMTKGDIKELRDDLEAHAPPAVQRHMPNDTNESAPTISNAVTPDLESRRSPTVHLDMPTL